MIAGDVLECVVDNCVKYVKGESEKKEYSETRLNLVEPQPETLNSS